MQISFSIREILESRLICQYSIYRGWCYSGHDTRELGIDLFGGHFVLHRRSIGWFDFLSIELIPVDVFEPGMVLDFIGGVVAQSLRGIPL